MPNSMRCPLKYPGSKWRLSPWITSFFPEHKFYLEPYFGSGAAFFAKSPSPYETVNDKDELVVNFFRACREYPEELAHAIRLTPYARAEFRHIEEDAAGQTIHLTGDCIEDARRFCVRCFQGFGSKLADRVGWKNTKAPNGPVNPRVWNNVPDAILSVAGRLKNAQIENTDALELIAACNHSDCLIYADPPYLGDTRNRKRIYRHEMMHDLEHAQLLNLLLDHCGPVIISGYDNGLYNSILDGWHKEYHTTNANNGGQRVEVLWMNFNGQLNF